VTVSFNGGGNQSTWRKPPTCHNSNNIFDKYYGHWSFTVWVTAWSVLFAIYILGKRGVLSHLDRFPPSTLEDLLTNFIDITTTPTQEFLHKLTNQATKEEDKIKIQHLANVSFWMLINSFQYLIHISVTSEKTIITWCAGTIILPIYVCII